MTTDNIVVVLCMYIKYLIYICIQNFNLTIYIFQGKFVSMGVISDGSYGTPPDVIYSFPVTIGPDRKWQIVQGLQIKDFSSEKMKLTGDELLQEREEALAVCQD